MWTHCIFNHVYTCVSVRGCVYTCVSVRGYVYTCVSVRGCVNIVHLPTLSRRGQQTGLKLELQVFGSHLIEFWNSHLQEQLGFSMAKLSLQPCGRLFCKLDLLEDYLNSLSDLATGC